MAHQVCALINNSKRAYFWEHLRSRSSAPPSHTPQQNDSCNDVTNCQCRITLPRSQQGKKESLTNIFTWPEPI